MKHLVRTLVIFCCVFSCMVWGQENDIMQILPGKHPLELLNIGGIEVRMSNLSSGTVMTFKKLGEERRLLALKVKTENGLSAFKALEMAMMLDLAAGQSARACVVFLEENGGCWSRTGMQLQQREETIRLSLNKLREAAFSRDDNKQLDWDKVREVWLGVVLDGAGDGKVKISRLAFSNQKVVPGKSYEIKVPRANGWHRSADPAAKTSIEDVICDGAPAIKMKFTFPLGRHMYFTPTMQLPDFDYASYSGIRITYKATIPRPIDGLLVTVYEGNAGFIPNAAPKPSTDWTTVDIMFAEVKNVPWAKKAGDDSSLAVEQISRLCIGCHGSAKEDDGQGEIFIRKLELIP